MVARLLSYAYYRSKLSADSLKYFDIHIRQGCVKGMSVRGCEGVHPVGENVSLDLQYDKLEGDVMSPMIT